MSILEPFDEAKFYLGQLCVQGHEYFGSGKTLRRKNRNCIECEREAVTRYRATLPDAEKERQRQKARDRYERNKDKYRRPSSYYRDLYANSESYRNSIKRATAKYISQPANRERQMQRHKEYAANNWKAQYLKHREKVAAYRRARLEKIAATRGEPYSSEELRAKLESHNFCCIYCGNRFGKGVKLNWDHVVPVSKGGVDCLENLVPSCKRCNVRKYCADALEWYKAQAFFDVSQFEIVSACYRRAIEACRES